MNISFLTGSGFSIPYGLPSVSVVNQKYFQFEPDQIYIAGNQRAYLQGSEIDRNGLFKYEENLFLSEFMKFYCNNFANGNFDYEDFFDFFMLYKTNDENKEKIELFCHEFESKNDLQKLGASQRISDFERTYSQLIASSLRKVEFEDDNEPYDYRGYSEFMHFIKDLTKSRIVNFNTLNHDLLMDWLGKQYFGNDLSDGFKLEGSPVYGSLSKSFNIGQGKRDINKNYFVKIPYYSDVFDGKINLYKLHGSINNYYVYYNRGANYEIFKNIYGVGDFYVEKINQNGTYEMEYALEMVAPNFISGKQNKPLFYENSLYFKKLITHFKNNLDACDKLVVIGYGFKDEGINEIIRKCIIQKSKELIVFDIADPTEFTPKYEKLKYHKCNFIKLSKEELTQIVGIE